MGGVPCPASLLQTLSAPTAAIPGTKDGGGHHALCVVLGFAHERADGQAFSRFAQGIWLVSVNII